MRRTRWIFVAAAAAFGATLYPPAEAAQATPPADAAPVSATARADEPITFEQYREWRLNQIERRRDDLAAQLAASDLPERQKTRLEHIKVYYDWLAGLPEAERDHRFRERFDRIDTNHDGMIDAGERAAWHDKQRAFYQRGNSLHRAAAETQ